jgi:hypothetical protein
MSEGRRLEGGSVEGTLEKLRPDFQAFKTVVSKEVAMPEKSFDPHVELSPDKKEALDIFMEIVRLVTPILEPSLAEIKLSKQLLESLQTLKTRLSESGVGAKELRKRGDLLLAQVIDYVARGLGV